MPHALGFVDNILLLKRGSPQNCFADIECLLNSVESWSRQNCMMLTTHKCEVMWIGPRPLGDVLLNQTPLALVLILTT